MNWILISYIYLFINLLFYMASNYYSREIRKTIAIKEETVWKFLLRNILVFIFTTPAILSFWLYSTILDIKRKWRKQND